MRIVRECIFEQEDFNGIGFNGIQVEYERTLKISGSEEAVYQLYKASGRRKMDDGALAVIKFYIVVDGYGRNEDDFDIRSREMCAIPESLGNYICEQHTSEVYLLGDQMEWITDVNLADFGVLFPNGMSKDEYDLTVATGEI